MSQKWLKTKTHQVKRLMKTKTVKNWLGKVEKSKKQRV